jgi:hypothetical protein
MEKGNGDGKANSDIVKHDSDEAKLTMQELDEDVEQPTVDDPCLANAIGRKGIRSGYGVMLQYPAARGQVPPDVGIRDPKIAEEEKSG